MEQDGEELGAVLFDPTYSEAAKRVVRDSAPNFFLVDLRLTSGRPQFGFYFGPGEDPALHASPPLAIDLVKFDETPKVGRVYDNGYEIIYDVRNLLEDKPRNISAASGSDGRVNSAAPGIALTQRIDTLAVTKRLVGRAEVNYDAGVLRHVTK
jgi:hypothetical protein